MESVLRFFHPVLPSKELGSAPIEIRVANTNLVLFRDVNLRPAALLNQCPHRLAKLSAGKVCLGKIQCPYHGWSFNEEGEGRVPSLPHAKPKVQAFRVVERYGTVWVANQNADPESIPMLAPEDHFQYCAFGVEFAASIEWVLDNFSEDEHLPFVHGRLGWTKENAAKIQFHFSRQDCTTQICYSGPQRPVGPALWLTGIRRGDTMENDWTHYFDPCRATYSMSWRSPAGKSRPFRALATVFFVPQTGRTTLVYFIGFATFGSRLLNKAFAASKPLLERSAKREILDDAKLAQRAFATDFFANSKMLLTKYDAPLAHNRKLLHSQYLQSPRLPEKIQVQLEN